MQKSELKIWVVMIAIIAPFLLLLATNATLPAIVVAVKRIGLAILTLSVLYRAYAFLKQRSKQNAAAKDG